MPWSVYNSSGQLLQATDGISNVLEDTTPQLGGNLDMQARLLVGNGGSTGIAISSVGEVTMAAQPGFLAYKSGTSSNIAGQSGLVTMGFNTEIFDQNSDYDSTNTFTAPVTGRYLIVTTLYVGGVTSAANVAAINIYTSNRTFNLNYGDPIPDANAEYSFNQTAIVDMDAADTVYIALRAYGESSNVWDIQGSASAGTSFSAWLLG